MCKMPAFGDVPAAVLCHGERFNHRPVGRAYGHNKSNPIPPPILLMHSTGGKGICSFGLPLAGVSTGTKRCADSRRHFRARFPKSSS